LYLLSNQIKNMEQIVFVMEKRVSFNCACYQIKSNMEQGVSLNCICYGERSKFCTEFNTIISDTMCTVKAVIVM